MGLQDYGVSLIKVDLNPKATIVDIQRLSYHFLREKTISSMIEIKPNILLCAS